MWVRIFVIFLTLTALGAAARRYVQPDASSGLAAAEEARSKILGMRGEWTKVARSDFEISIREDGELKPVKVTSLMFLIPGKIGYLMPEGTEVHKGDRVIALETKDLEEDIQHIREDLDTAETNLAQQKLTRDLEMKRLGMELHAEFEKVDFALLKDRELIAHPNEVEKENANNILASAKARMDSAQGDLKLCQPLFDKGFCSKHDYDLKVITVSKARIEEERAEMKARIINDGPLPEERLGAQLNLDYASRGFKYKQIDNADQIYALTLKVKSAERVAATLQRKLAKRELELERSTLHAPHDGVVVYRTMGYRNNKKPELGERVSPWLAPVDLPNYTTMKVRTQVPESLIRKIQERTPALEGSAPHPGSTARVEINTLPGIVYAGHVIWIDGWARDRNSKLSDADVKAQGLSGVKVFDVEVELDTSDPTHLREGFRAKVDFPEEMLKGVITIPEQAVSTIDGMSSVMVMDGSPAVRKIELGRASHGKVVVLSGLKDGEKIYVPKIVEPAAAESENTAKKSSKSGDKKAPPKNGPPAKGNGPSKNGAADWPRDKSSDRAPERSQRPDSAERRRREN